MLKPLKIGDLTISVPIIQGGMGIGISMEKLSSAVTNAGGLGVISTVGLGILYSNPDKPYFENNRDGFKIVIDKARKLTDGILGVNIMHVLNNFEDLVKTAIEEKIDIIFSGAGLPLDLPKHLTPGSKTKLVPIVSSGRAAAIIAQKWKNNFDYLPDAFVVEGPKAGGHLGFAKEAIVNCTAKLETILQETLKVAQDLEEKYKRKIPVIAAGGIMTGKDIYKYIKMGASAVQMGSRFVATEECDASDEFKNAILGSTKETIKIIDSPVGMPGRALDTDFVKSADNGERRPTVCKYNCIKTCNPKTTKYCIADALYAAYEGDLDNGFVFTGADSHMIKELTTVPELMEELISGYNEEEKNNG